jgi:glucosyl-dolichyl phosphate glucuronosyltransferase
MSTHVNSAEGRECGPSTSVIICAYTMERWQLLNESIEAAVHQDPQPREVIIVVDDDEMLGALAQRWFAEERVFVYLNSGQGRSEARNTGAFAASGKTLVFLDDDAVPAPGWLEKMVLPLEREDVVAVGGKPEPRFQVTRPSWFPYEFDWIFGCHYFGMPETLAPIEHVIGTTMAMRRTELIEIGGFHTPKLEDLDISLRFVHRWPQRSIVYQPEAIVSHAVPPERLAWSYFWRRCFMENRSKVDVHSLAGQASSLSAERGHVLRTIPRAYWDNIKSIASGDWKGAQRIVASGIGVLMAGLGFFEGSIETYVRRAHRSSRTRREAV